jgi:hypothetical protein
MAFFQAKAGRGCGCLTICAALILILCGIVFSKRFFRKSSEQKEPSPLQSSQTQSPAPSPFASPSPVAIATPKPAPTPVRRERVTLTADCPLYVEDEFYRDGAAGEEFEVWMRRPDLKKVFVLSRGWEGKQVVLNVAEEFIAPANHAPAGDER